MRRIYVRACDRSRELSILQGQRTTSLSESSQRDISQYRRNRYRNFHASDINKVSRSYSIQLRLHIQDIRDIRDMISIRGLHYLSDRYMRTCILQIANERIDYSDTNPFFFLRTSHFVHNMHNHFFSTVHKQSPDCMTRTETVPFRGKNIPNFSLRCFIETYFRQNLWNASPAAATRVEREKSREFSCINLTESVKWDLLNQIEKKRRRIWTKNIRQNINETQILDGIYSSVSYRNKKQSFNIFITFFNLYYDCLSMQIKKFFQFFYVHFYFCNINA